MANPGNGLALFELTVEDAQQSEAAEERRGVQVGNVRLQGRLVVVAGGRNVLQDGLEQGLEVIVVGQRAVLRLGVTRSAGATRGVHHGNVKRSIKVEVRIVFVQV